MGYNRNKIPSLILFISTLVFITLMAITFWNTIRNGSPLGGWPLVFFILAVGSAACFFLIYLRATNPETIEEKINTQVNNVRAKLLEELNQNKETVEEVNSQEDIENTVSKILPKGTIKSPDTYAKKLLANMADEFQIMCGVFYSYDNQKKVFSRLADYAMSNKESIADFKIGENLNGQAAENQEIMVVSEITEDYFTVE
jgi:uncharacterized membrane protein